MTDSVKQLEALVANLVGAPCWAALAGGCTGSRFILELGDKVKLLREEKNPNLSSLERQYQGQFALHVGCAAWRLDGPDGVVTAWTDLATVDGPMVSGLNMLLNRTITAARVVKPGLDLQLDFDGGYTLRVFCDQVDPDLGNYTVSEMDTYIEVESRSRVVVEISGTVEENRGDVPVTGGE